MATTPRARTTRTSSKATTTPLARKKSTSTLKPKETKPKQATKTEKPVRGRPRRKSQPIEYDDEIGSAVSWEDHAELLYSAWCWIWEMFKEIIAIFSILGPILLITTAIILMVLSHKVSHLTRPPVDTGAISKLCRFAGFGCPPGKLGESLAYIDRMRIFQKTRSEDDIWLHEYVRSGELVNEFLHELSEQETKRSGGLTHAIFNSNMTRLKKDMEPVLVKNFKSQADFMNDVDNMIDSVIQEQMEIQSKLAEFEIYHQRQRQYDIQSNLTDQRDWLYTPKMIGRTISKTLGRGFGEPIDKKIAQLFKSLNKNSLRYIKSMEGDLDAQELHGQELKYLIEWFAQQLAWSKYHSNQQALDHSQLTSKSYWEKLWGTRDRHEHRDFDKKIKACPKLYAFTERALDRASGDKSIISGISDDINSFQESIDKINIKLDLEQPDPLKPYMETVEKSVRGLKKNRVTREKRIHQRIGQQRLRGIEQVRDQLPNVRLTKR
ncbi:hypothetical protein BT63DRAFT_455109 [Microthyrium microscopicum]|uniref:Uncharacterized protein n=1 Tax=Microthyrium microscopicum TaxID=703497 RepID=A0A6A6UA51_9PEZI|nr:hypothetical protein BT63DRAFT_455109 [Microthyrium microscopicum]